MVQACDAAMSRAFPRFKRAMFWWTEVVAHFRDRAMRARRTLKRARRRSWWIRRKSRLESRT